MEPDEIIRALRLCADKSENFEECHSGQCDCPFGKTVIDCTERMNRDAADMIESLTDEIPHWIDAEDETPDIGQTVLVYLPDKEEEKIRVGEYLGEGDYRIGRKVYHGYEIGAWMPLPQPPKEEK